MLVIRLRTISSETFSTCPIFKFWTLPSCTCSPCRCLHSASIVSASSRSIVVCAESVEQHQLICLLGVILHVLLPCPFIALLSRFLFPIHLSIHISFYLVHLFLFLCFFFSHFPSTPFLLPLDSSTYSPSLRSNHIVLVFSLAALALLFCLHFSHLIPFLSTSLTFLATLSRPFLLLFFLPPIFVSCPFSSSLYVVKMQFDLPSVSSSSAHFIPLLSPHSPFHFPFLSSTTSGWSYSYSQLSPCLPLPPVSTYV